MSQWTCPRDSKESKMISGRRLVLIINECVVLLSLLSMFIHDVTEGGLSYAIQENAIFYVPLLFSCLLLPLGLLKPGWAISGFLTILGAALVSFIGFPLLIGLVGQEGSLFSALFDIGGGVLEVILIPFWLCGIFFSSVTATEWLEERCDALSESELKKREEPPENTWKILIGLLVALYIVIFIWMIMMEYRAASSRGVSAWNFGIEMVKETISIVIHYIPYLLFVFLIHWISRRFNRPAPKEKPCENTAKSVESCLEKETIQGDMEALTLLERSRNDPREQGIESKAAFYVNLSQAQYRRGYFGKAKESIREGLAFYDKLVLLEGGETDAALDVEAKLHDVGSRISGVLEEYGAKLDECRSMLSALESRTSVDAYHAEIGKAFTEMADALRGLGQYEEAREACDRAVAELKQLASQKTTVARRTYARLNTVRAQILLDTGKIEEAEKCASEAIELYSGMNESYECTIGAAHFVMAAIQSECGNTEKAEKEYLIAESLIRDRYGKNHPIYKMSQRDRSGDSNGGTTCSKQ